MLIHLAEKLLENALGISLLGVCVRAHAQAVLNTCSVNVKKDVAFSIAGGFNLLHGK